MLGFQAAMAGEHKPLCDKVRESDLIFEMRFEQRGKYPADYRKKRWAPPTGELQKTARTGKTVAVWKGPIAVGATWTPRYGIGFTLGSDPATWETFFARETFSKIYFLVQEGESYAPTGWAEESAGCDSSAHWSWCSDYAVFQDQVKACLK
jgi:hypothetical protein